MRNASKSGYAIFAATSENGVTFSAMDDTPVLRAGEPDAWDSFEVTTPRLFERGGVFYMLYAGSGAPSQKDKPQAFGLARSYDLLTWERYSHNPVFCTGAQGEWDDGAIWFGTVFAWDSKLYLMYEGGAKADVDRPGLALTQVGIAAVDLATFDRRMADW